MGTSPLLTRRWPMISSACVCRGASLCVYDDDDADDDGGAGGGSDGSAVGDAVDGYWGRGRK